MAGSNFFPPSGACGMTVAEFPKQQQHWLKRCLTSDNGKTPLSVLANVMTALEVDTEIRDAYALGDVRAPPGY
jgi:hypothetical protein